MKDVMIKKNLNLNASSNKFVIVGAGLTGLLTAYYLSKKINPKNIFLIESSHNFGGYYGSANYGLDKIFDYGMHIIYETCINEIDSLFLEIMPENEWIFLQNNKKDVAGIFYNERLQNYSPYVDLRSFPEQEFNYLKNSFFSNLANIKPESDEDNAENYLINRFGYAITNKIHAPLLSRLYSLPPQELTNLAIKLTALERICLLDKEDLLIKSDNEFIKSRIAYPDQANLPFQRKSKQRGLYPKKFGMINFINRLVNSLKRREVNFLVNSKINSIDYVNNIINYSNMSNFDIKYDHIFWTAGWAQLANILKFDSYKTEKPKSIPSFPVYLIIKNKPKMDNLYYFYCYDNFATFRVTNYSSYCPSSVKNGLYKLCVELWPSRLNLSCDLINTNYIKKLASKELLKMGIINGGDDIIFSEIGKPLHFPLPSINNKNLFLKINQEFNYLGLDNFHITGVQSEKNIFFQQDILIDSFNKINKINVK